MTRLMEQVIERLQAIPADQQDRLARYLLDELEEDVKWAQSTAKHAGKLKGLIDSVLAADARGECKPLDPKNI